MLSAVVSPRPNGPRAAAAAGAIKTKEGWQSERAIGASASNCVPSPGRQFFHSRKEAAFPRRFGRCVSPRTGGRGDCRRFMVDPGSIMRFAPHGL